MTKEQWIYYDIHGERCRLPRHYKPLKKIGIGSSSIVVSARDLRNGEKVAIKKVRRVFGGKEDALRVLEELRVLNHLKSCRFTVNLLDCFMTSNEQGDDDIYLVFEYVRTDLRKLVKSGTDLSSKHIAFIVFQLLRGLKDIHDAKVLHRDISKLSVGSCLTFRT